MRLATRMPNPEVEVLVDRGAQLTAEMARLDAEYERLARERARVWARAVRYGATKLSLARAANLHHSQIGKALDRYVDV